MKENEINYVKTGKKEPIQRSKIKKEEVEEKFIQRKRKCQTSRVKIKQKLF